LPPFCILLIPSRKVGCQTVCRAGDSGRYIKENMNPLSWERHPAVNYHYEEGKAWLMQSKRGKRCTALSYAAFEFRLAIERITFQYWYTINDNEINSENINDVRSFKRMQNKIYKLGGVQKEINKYFEFMQIIIDNLKIDKKLATPDLGRLHNHWDNCSELCHITWTITPKDRKFKQQVLKELEEVQATLESYTSGLTSFPKIADENLRRIQKQYIANEIDKVDVEEYLKKIGVWAVTSDNDGGNREFIGTAIPPDKN
jgi:hypothetical protein